MNLLITYDIHTGSVNGSHKLSKLNTLLKNYATRVQNSVWECELYPDELEELKGKIEKLLIQGDGNVRIYQLPKDWEKKTTQIIGSKPPRPSDPLII
jgi:CRISPR-associated protein Cas2